MSDDGPPRREFPVDADEVGARVEQFLVRRLGFAHGLALKALRKGWVRVDGKRAKPGQRLERDATVKITDVTGKLVFETTALGGQAIWEGRDYNGRRVNSGVYLVFSSSNPRFTGFTGKADAAVAKIMVLN